jgi:uncharacterized protein (DUF362 family)
MPQLTRRDFLRTGALVGTGLALSPRLPSGSLFAQEAPAPAAMAIARWDAAALAKADLVAVATRLTESAVAALGGMGRFVSKGDVVWVKPNIGWNARPELAADTNPQVVGTLVRLCLEAGAKTVKVGDNPCHPAQQAYTNSGIAAAVTAAGGQVVYLDEKRYRDMKLAGERLANWPIYAEIAEADLVINVPIAKHHGLSRASLCMKNYMGVVGGQRHTWHQNLDTCLCDITQFMRPRLTVLDAVRTLTDHGPTGGDPRDVKLVGTVAASTDIVALDAFGATLLGRSLADIGSIKAAEARGLGNADFRALSPKELTLS